MTLLQHKEERCGKRLRSSVNLRGSLLPRGHIGWDLVSLRRGCDCLSRLSIPSNAIDVYNSTTGVWSPSNLSEARASVAATSVGDVAFFAGGLPERHTGAVLSNAIDVHNSTNESWSILQLVVARQKILRSILPRLERHVQLIRCHALYLCVCVDCALALHSNKPTRCSAP